MQIDNEFIISKVTTKLTEIEREELEKIVGGAQGDLVRKILNVSKSYSNSTVEIIVKLMTKFYFGIIIRTFAQ